ncbi:ankyrin repeat-containing domain protein [Aspergillus germanicus]
MAKTLLEHAANPETRDRMKRTALSYAGQSLDSGLISLLVWYGAKVDQKDGSGRTAFSWVASSEQYTESDVSFDSWSLTAAQFSNTNKTQQILGELKRRGANIYEPDDDGRTTLSWAAEKGLQLMVEFICKSSAEDWKSHDILRPDKYGRSPLSYAAEKQRGNIILLLANGRKFSNDFDSHYRTPLNWLHLDDRDTNGYKKQSAEGDAVGILLGYLGLGEGGEMVKLETFHHPKPRPDAEILNRSVKSRKTLLSYAVLNDDNCSDIPNDDDKKTALMLALDRASSDEQVEVLKALVSLADPENALRCALETGLCDLFATVLCWLKPDNEHSALARMGLESIFRHAAPGAAVPFLETIFTQLKPVPEINKKLTSGRMPLEQARDSDQNTEQLVRLLLKHGADPGIWTQSSDWERCAQDG